MFPFNTSDNFEIITTIVAVIRLFPAAAFFVVVFIVLIVVAVLIILRGFSFQESEGDFADICAETFLLNVGRMRTPIDVSKNVTLFFIHTSHFSLIFIKYLFFGFSLPHGKRESVNKPNTIHQKSYIDDYFATN